MDNGTQSPGATETSADAKLDQLLNRISSLTGGGKKQAAPEPPVVPQVPAEPAVSNVIRPESLVVHDQLTSDPAAEKKSGGPSIEMPSDSGPKEEFVPKAPRTLAEAGVSAALVEELICKFLLAAGEASVRKISDQVALPMHLIEEQVAYLKNEQVLGYIGQAAMNDYICKLTEAGRDRARVYNNHCTYFGAAPVSFDAYVQSVNKQTINDQNPTQEDLERAFSDLLIDPAMMTKLGPAVNSGKGMFLFGFPGNGKTSIAERITAAFGPTVWVPRSMTVDRDIIRIFDAMNHIECPLEEQGGILTNDQVDRRWVRIRRPTIVVGGELTMEHLELQYNPETGISEAPVQMKSNTGLLLIDDFGRQRMSVDELLNRWIVPLEKRYDFLNTSNGKKIQVPFDQLVVFSTNLEPKDLVDDAFLRRIPYKIEVPNPSLENFIKLFEIMCRIYKFDWRPDLVKQLIEKHYIPLNRPLRNCHPRDLLLQVRNWCKYLKRPHELSEEGFDFACDNYFSIM
ncbi:MAG: AAA family ATPase [Planctomycetota bacterium]